MKVKYKISKVIHDALLDIFYETKEVEDNWNLAQIYEKENEIVYRTCCNNEWFVGHDGQNYYFGYRGTRNGFIRVQPFRDSRYGVPRFYLDYPSEPYPIWKNTMEMWICIRSDYISNMDNDNDNDVRRIWLDFTIDGYDREEEKEVTFNYICYELLRLLEYETTLPKNIVHPLDRVETTLVDDKIAVIMRGRDLVYPLMVIEYKNMYKNVQTKREKSC
ncbi:MAG: hypothetical protein QXH44_09220 [Pyrobaculum sp.]